MAVPRYQEGYGAFRFVPSDFFRHAVTSFHYLLRRNDQRIQTYRAVDLADAIAKNFDVDDGDPRVRAVWEFLDDNTNVCLTVRNW